MTVEASSAPTASRPSATDGELLRVDELKVWFPITEGIVIERHIGDVRAVDDVSFALRRGETLGLVGESGCGKSTTGRAIIRLYRPTSGRIVFDGVDLSSLEGSALRRMRRRMQMIFQDPYASLNPRMNVSGIIREPLAQPAAGVEPTARRRRRGRGHVTAEDDPPPTPLDHRIRHRDRRQQRNRIWVKRQQVQVA